MSTQSQCNCKGRHPHNHPHNDHVEQGALTEFKSRVGANPNTSGSITPPLQISTDPSNPAVLGTIALRIDEKTDHVWLTGTVGWNVPVTGMNHTIILFKIYKNPTSNNPSSGQLIFSTKDIADRDESPTTSFNHVDKDVKDKKIRYVLTAEIAQGSAGNQAFVIGPTTFTAAEIEPKLKNK
jgi:hypothetical protein